MKITCCTNCVPPKRTSTCHIDCKEYLTEREKLNEENKKHHIEQQVRSTLTINSFNQCISSTRKQRKIFRNSCK